MRDHPTSDRLLDPVTVTLRPRSWETSAPIVVDLYPLRPYLTGEPREWQVRHEGQIVGYVERYTGSIDRVYRGSRLRHLGKRRTLWAYRATLRGRAMNEQVSRADCIRHLIRQATQRENR